MVDYSRVWITYLGVLTMILTVSGVGTYYLVKDGGDVCVEDGVYYSWKATAVPYRYYCAVENDDVGNKGKVNWCSSTTKYGNVTGAKCYKLKLVEHHSPDLNTSVSVYDIMDVNATALITGNRTIGGRQYTQVCEVIGNNLSKCDLVFNFTAKFDYKLQEKDLGVKFLVINGTPNIVNWSYSYANSSQKWVVVGDVVGGLISYLSLQAYIEGNDWQVDAVPVILGDADALAKFALWEYNLNPGSENEQPIPSSTNYWWNCQSFTVVTQDHNIDTISVLIRDDGTQTTNLHTNIRNTTATLPSGDLGNCTDVTPDEITTSQTWVNISCSGIETLRNDTMYAFCMRIDEFNKVYWNLSYPVASTYAGGQRCLCRASDYTSCFNDGYDWAFMIWTNDVGGNTAPSVPNLHLPLNNTASKVNTEFNWSNSTDTDGDSLIYWLETSDNYGFSNLTGFWNDSVAETANTTGVSVSFTADNIYYWRVKADDTNDSGNSSYSEVRTFVLDTTSPSLSIDSPINQTYKTTDMSLNFACNDGVKGSGSDALGYWIDDVFNSTTGNITFGVGQGDHNLTGRCNDSLNQFSGGVEVVFFVDTINPLWSGNVSNVSSGGVYSPSVSYDFTLIIEDASLMSLVITFDNVNYTLGQSVGNGSYNYTIVGLEAGLHEYNYTIWDILGNLNLSDSWTYDVQKANATVSLWLDGAEANLTKDYGLSVNISAYYWYGGFVNETDVTLKIGGLEYVNPSETLVLGAGVYNVSSVLLDTTNFTGFFIEYELNVSTIVANLSINLSEVWLDKDVDILGLSVNASVTGTSLEVWSDVTGSLAVWENTSLPYNNLTDVNWSEGHYLFNARFIHPNYTYEDANASFDINSSSLNVTFMNAINYSINLTSNYEFNVTPNGQGFNLTTIIGCYSEEFNNTNCSSISQEVYTNNWGGSPEYLAYDDNWDTAGGASGIANTAVLYMNHTLPAVNTGVPSGVWEVRDCSGSDGFYNITLDSCVESGRNLTLLVESNYYATQQNVTYSCENSSGWNILYTGGGGSGWCGTNPQYFYDSRVVWFLESYLPSVSGIFNITNNGSLDVDVYARLNQSINETITFWISNTTNETNGRSKWAVSINTNDVLVYTNLTIGDSFMVWNWVDVNNTQQILTEWVHNETVTTHAAEKVYNLELNGTANNTIYSTSNLVGFEVVSLKVSAVETRRATSYENDSLTTTPEDGIGTNASLYSNTTINGTYVIVFDYTNFTLNEGQLNVTLDIIPNSSWLSDCRDDLWNLQYSQDNGSSWDVMQLWTYVYNWTNTTSVYLDNGTNETVRVKLVTYGSGCVDQYFMINDTSISGIWDVESAEGIEFEDYVIGSSGVIDYFNSTAVANVTFKTNVSLSEDVLQYWIVSNASEPSKPLVDGKDYTISSTEGFFELLNKVWDGIPLNLSYTYVNYSILDFDVVFSSRKTNG